MKFTTVKKDSQIKLAGITVETEYRDASLYVITLRDANGGMVRISGGYGITTLVPAIPAMVKRYRLSGKFGGLVDVCEDFGNEHDAKARLSEFEAKHAGRDSEIGLAISTVEVPEEE
jgi:hypothetical protein